MRNLWLTLALTIVASNLKAVYHQISYYETDSNLWSIQTTEDFAFLGLSDKLEIIDISDPYNPEIVNEFVTNSIIQDIEIVDSNVIILSDMQLYFIDMTNINNLVLQSTFEINYPYPLISEFAVKESKIVIPMREFGIHVVDFSDIMNPVLDFTALAEYEIHKINIYENLIIAFGDNELPGLLLWIFEISDLEHPELKFEYQIHTDPCETLDPVDAILYVSTLNDRITVFNIEDLDNIYVIGQIEQHADAMIIEDTILSIFSPVIGYLEIDVEDLTNPFVTGRYSIHINMWCFILTKRSGFLYHQAPNGLAIVKIIDPTNTSCICSINNDLQSRTISSFIEDERLYIVELNDILTIYDISEPDFPILLNSIVIENINTIIVKNNIAYIFCLINNRLIKIYNFTDASNPLFESEILVENWIKAYNCSDTHLYICDNEFKIYNIEDPANPFLVSQNSFTEDAEFSVLIDNKIYVGEYGLKIIDVTNPAAPFIVNTYNEPIVTFTINGDFLIYLELETGNFKIVDISDLSNPMIISEIDLNMICCPFLMPAPIIYGNHILISDPLWNIIYTYDISDPYNPQFDQEYSWNIAAYDWYKYGGYLVVHDDFNGIHILEDDALLQYSDNTVEVQNYNLKNYPNPFNPITKIEFTLTEECFVELSIYNIKGQKINTLAKKKYEHGLQSVIWDGKDTRNKQVSSGVYYYNLLINGKLRSVKKCVMLK